MRWNELKPDLKIGMLSCAIRELDCLSAISITTNLALGIRIYALPGCLESAKAHVRNNHYEVGGLLLGSVWDHTLPMRNSTGPLVILVHAVPSQIYRNSPVSLEMDTEIWGRSNERAADRLIVVGWYHSHPNLGAFFSGTDRRTQKAFFGHPYSIGWVLDPFRDEEKLFVGKNSEEYLSSLLVISNELEMAQNH